jgi:hypothetical protein
LTDKAEDRRIFQELLQSLNALGDKALPIGDVAVAVGRFFLGSPYAVGTLERRGEEKLVLNLRQFDCFTFVENAVVLARLIRAGKEDFADYTAALTQARYRGGHRNGYASRLHYFSDWLRDNQKKMILKDVTREIGGKAFPKGINFMTKNPGLYPALKSLDVCREIEAVERRCSRRRFFHIPKKELKNVQAGIQEGDLIGVTTDTEGLDIVHAGLAIRVKKEIHLLHASRAAGMVVISPETLSRYLAAMETRAGIMVGRIRRNLSAITSNLSV